MSLMLVPVLRIRIQIRIRIHMFLGLLDPDPDPLVRGMDPDPSNFIIDTQDAKKKFFCILLFEGTFTSFFKDIKSKRSHKTVEIKVFLTIFA